MEKVKFDYSQSEMVAYLITRGYEYCDISIKENPRYKNKIKVFFTFEGDKNELIKLLDEFNNKVCEIKLKDYIENLMEVKRLISVEMNKIK